jgi:hypothetical protein
MNCIKEDYDEIELQVVIGGKYAARPDTDGEWLDPTRNTLLDRLMGYARPASHEQSMSYKARYQNGGFLVDVRLGIVTESDREAVRIRNNVLMGLRMMNSVGSTINPPKAIEPVCVNGILQPKRKCLNLAIGEMVGLLAWPYGETYSPLLPSIHPQVVMPPKFLSDYTFERSFGVSNAEGEEMKLGITPTSASFHTYLLGPTGSGKTTAMLQLILADIKAGRGTFVLDPKADLVRDILQRIPKHRLKDVVVIDPMSACPTGINPFAAVKDGADAGVVADGLLAVFQKVSGAAWGKRMEDVLACSLLTLAKTKDANLLMLPTLLTDTKFRQKITAPIIKADPLGLGTFWKNYEAMSDTARRQVIAPAMSRLRQFTLREPLRYILGQSSPKFNLNDLFTKNKIVLVSLNKGKLGEEIANLVGLTIISQVWSLTLARANVAPAKRDLVSVYIDEVQNFLNLPVPLDEAFSQARAFNVAFHIANQYLAQLPKDLQSTVFANVANWVVFGLNSPDDCSALAKFAGTLDAEDFKYLPRYHVYFRNFIGGTPIWLSGKTLPAPVRTTNADELVKLSESLYGASRSDIDADNLAKFNFEKDIAGLLKKTSFGVVKGESEVTNEPS